MPVPDFSPGEVLTASAMDSIGLWKIAETTFSATTTPFINGCFTSTYDNYRIVIQCHGSAATNFNIRLRSGTSTPETGAVYDRYGFGYLTGLTNFEAANQTTMNLGNVSSTSASRLVLSADLFNPNVANIHTVLVPYVFAGNNQQVILAPVRIETNTQYTGIEIYGDTGTLTGTMRVYGYRN